jgi:hypothetical protein
VLEALRRITTVLSADVYGTEHAGRLRVPASVRYPVIDSVGPAGIVPFWCGLLGVEVDATIREGPFVVLHPTSDGLTAGLHFDLAADDLGDATREIEGLGAYSLTLAVPETSKDSACGAWRTQKSLALQGLCHPRPKSRAPARIHA